VNQRESEFVISVKFKSIYTSVQLEA